MDSFRFYELYLAFTQHFHPEKNYNFFKYNGKIKCNENSFRVTKGKLHYDKFAQKLKNEHTAICFLTGNFLYRDIKFITDCSMEPYNKFMAYNEALYYKFEQDVIKYTQDKCPIKESYSGSKDSWIYLTVLNNVYADKIIKAYDKKFKDDLLWSNLKNQLTRFDKFIPHCYQITPEKKNILKNLVIKNTK